MCRIRSVIESDSVLAIRGALARDDQNLAVGRGAYVVDDSRIDFHRVGQLWMSRIGYVIDQKSIGDRRVISIPANNPFLGALEFFEWRPPDNFEFAFEVARCNYDRSAARNIATACR